MTPRDKWGVAGTTVTIGAAFALVILAAAWVLAQFAYALGFGMEGFQ